MKKDNLLFLDVDGTIYDNKNERIPPDSVEAIRLVHESGRTRIIIATGRAPNMLEHLNIIKPYISGYVLLNGQYVECEGNTLHSTPISRETLQKLDAFAKRKNVPLGVVGLKNANVSFLNENVEVSFNSYQIKPYQVGDFDFSFDVYQGWLFGDAKMISEAAKLVLECQFLHWGQNGCDIITKGTSKAIGVKVLIDRFRVRHENTYAIGDSNNDIEMIQSVKYGIAMGNGTKEIREVSCYVTERIDQRGLYDALKRFKLF